jgi:predicted ATPase
MAISEATPVRAAGDGWRNRHDSRLELLAGIVDALDARAQTIDHHHSPVLELLAPRARGLRFDLPAALLDLKAIALAARFADSTPSGDRGALPTF